MTERPSTHVKMNMPSSVDLKPHFRACAQLAWASFAAGNVGVGCRILDAEGGLVSEGQNQSLFENDGAPDFSRSAVAHAEIDALRKVHIPAVRGGVLVSSLQPCDMCTGASLLADLKQVVYLAPDPYWQAATGHSHFHYVVHEPYSALSALLPLITFAERWTPEQCHKFEERYPILFALAKHQAMSGQLRQLGDPSHRLKDVIDMAFHKVDIGEVCTELRRTN